MIWFIPCSYKIYTAETFVWLLSSLEPRPCLCPRPSSGMMETCKSLAVICYFLIHSYEMKFLMSMVEASTVVHLSSSLSILKNLNFSWKAQQNPKSSGQPSHYATQVGTCAEHSSIFGTFRPSNANKRCIKSSGKKYWDDLRPMILRIRGFKKFQLDLEISLILSSSLCYMNVYRKTFGLQSWTNHCPRWWTNTHFKFLWC